MTKRRWRSCVFSHMRFQPIASSEIGVARMKTRIVCSTRKKKSGYQHDMLLLIRMTQLNKGNYAPCANSTLLCYNKASVNIQACEHMMATEWKMLEYLSPHPCLCNRGHWLVQQEGLQDDELLFANT